MRTPQPARRWTVDEQIVHHRSGLQIRFGFAPDGTPLLDVRFPTEPAPRAASVIFMAEAPAEPMCVVWLADPGPLSWIGRPATRASET